MLQTEVIHNLDIIAFEGWEYHKLPLENLEGYSSNSAGGRSEPRTAKVPGKNKLPETNPVRLNKGYDLLSPAE